MDFTGTSGDDTITGTSGDDLFKVFQGGNDTVNGLTGSDVFNFAGTLTAADTIDGGGGQDTVQIKGDYSAGILFSATTMVNVETLTVGAGFNYTITTDDATVAAGAVFTLNAAALAAPNYVVFNGSNETDGLLHFHGGAGDDTVGMGANMIADDHFDGGDGNDMLILGGVNTLTFKSVTIHNIETIELVPTFGGSLAFNSGNVLLGQTMEIDGSSVGGAGYYTINGHNLPGNMIFDGGEHDVKVTGGSGNDTFNMGADFTRDDRLAGGTGNDTLNLNADYNLTLTSGTVTGIDQVNLAGGHNYHITSSSNLATDQTMTVNATGLTASDSLFLDFSSETLGSVILDGGAAPAILKGGQQGDAFDFSVTSQGGFTASDSIDGQGGYDRLYLDGDYSGAHALAFTNSTMTGVEEIDLNGGHSYDVTLANGNVANGASLKVDGSALGATDTMAFDASSTSSTITMTMIGGAGNDTLSAGHGATTLDLSHGGTDTATGGGSDDVFLMGNTLTADDRIDGRDGNDTLSLTGNYNLTFGADTFVGIEKILLGAGTATTHYTYTLSTVEANDPYPDILNVDASALLAGDKVILDTSAVDHEGDDSGQVNFIGGAGDDTVTTGALGGTFDLSRGGNDTVTGGFDLSSVFLMGAALNAGDRLDGGVAGFIRLDGDYTGTNAITVGSATLTNIGKITLTAGHSYHFVYSDANGPNVASGSLSFKFDASALGTSDTAYVDFSAVTNDRPMIITGGAGNDHILNMAGGTVDLSKGGNDIVNLNNGTAIMGAALTAADSITHANTVTLNGNYDAADGTALNLTTSSVSGSPFATLTAGHTYEITVSAAAVFSGFTTTSGTTNITFDGSAETGNHPFTFDIEGSGGTSTLTGGAGSDSLTVNGGDTVTFHGGGGNDHATIFGSFGSDQFDGGTGNDTLSFNFSETDVFTATSIASLETLILNQGGSITTVDANVGAGQTMSVAAYASLTFNGSAETDGHFNFFCGSASIIGGALSDTITVTSGNVTGGGGGDTIDGGTTLHYGAVSDSTSVNYDTILHLHFATTTLDLSTPLPTAIDAAFASGSLSTASFDSDLATAVNAAHLGVQHAVLFTASAGTLSGHIFLVVDANGVAGYQAGADLVMDVTGFSGTLTTSNFS